MPADQLLKLIDSTSEVLGLTGSVIEKDYYITQVIHILSKVENEHFHLVFAGGTCLAKAYKIIKRMSEDIDFKIQFKSLNQNFSKTQLLKELKKFRLHIISVLTQFNFIMSEVNVRNEGQYLRIELNYPSLLPVSITLRPHLLLEFSLSDTRLPTENFFIRSLIEDTLETAIISEPPLICCTSVTETAIEKWVGLTRRIVAIERGYCDDDPTLIRHVYDLNAIMHTELNSNNFFNLAKAIISSDAKQFENQHPEYADDPATEIFQSLGILKNKPIWKERYQNFIETMVYSNSPPQNYYDAIVFLENISHDVINFINLKN